MKNYEKVLMAIKMESDKKGTGTDCFEQISIKAEVPRQKLTVILNELRAYHEEDDQQEQHVDH